MDLPTATYRVQFNAGFGFRDAEAVVPYLADLGVSHLYASPIFKARKGSAHGYDITDPNTLNPELGTFRDLESLAGALGRLGMGWIQDIVPNHMAFDSGNRYLMDVLEKGPRSQYTGMFDIDWEWPACGTPGRVLVPVLAAPYGRCLERGDIAVALDAGGLSLRYADLRFPLRQESCAAVLGPVLGLLLEKSAARGHDAFRSTLLRLEGMGGGTAVEIEDGERACLDETLRELCRTDGEVREALDERLREVNGTPGDPESFGILDGILSRQFYRLAHWHVAAECVNYRRFFDINELIGVRVEDGDVFRLTHDLVGRLVSRGWITSLRVDHVDGLYDPSAYLERLRQAFPGFYIIVEKILAPGEELPRHWPAEGTTGYEFLNAVNGLFVRGESEASFDRLYRRFTGWTGTCGGLLAEKKRLVLERLFPADLERLNRLAARVARGTRRGRDLTEGRLKEALAQILTAFPVYRSYATSGPIREADACYIRKAAALARQRMPGHGEEIDFLEALLLDEAQEPPGVPLPGEARPWRMRVQQFTPPLAAKGFEDTLLYVYNRLMSLNEVGGSPDRFGLSPGDFYAFLEQRRRSRPLGLNATATHDTKRGEDHRARINVLSEIPGLWAKTVRHWSRINRRKKSAVAGAPVPERNLEYLIYQALVGALPPEGVTTAFRERIKAYVLKAAREAKTHTTWTEPDERYETACLQFVESMLTPGEGSRFLDALNRFCGLVSWYGMLNSLSQVLLKIASPGVPDFYQGTELWDYSLVDPDNRRPVDFGLRRRALAGIRERYANGPASMVEELLQSTEDGRVKLFLIWRALSARRGHASLFRDGEIIPLAARGRYRKHAVAFARRDGTDWAFVAVPRLLASVVKNGELPLGVPVWQDTAIRRVEGMPRLWGDVITGEKKRFDGDFPLGEVFSRFPAALLLGGGGHP